MPEAGEISLVSLPLRDRVTFIEDLIPSAEGTRA
jgi:hypothetical protein